MLLIVLKIYLVFMLFVVKCVKVEVIDSNYSFLKTEDCECYLLGTIGSIEGKSICNTESLQCKCHPNIIGKNCDQCMVGYYNILSGYGCFPCNCNPTGSIKNACDNHTGQCLCKPGYIGLKCDQCDFHNYQTSIRKCEIWNCNKYDSKEQQCNKTGCLENIERKYCDTCIENSYVLQGCNPCPACYYIVQDKFNDYENYFNFIINSIQDHFPLNATQYRFFIEQVLDLKNLVQNLKFKCEHDLNFFEIDILANVLIQETEYFHNEISNMIQRAYAIFDYNTIQQHQKCMDEGITELQDLIKENERLLENSTIISKTMARHSKKMMVISKDALEILNKLEKKMENMSLISNNTLQMCNETCKLNATYSKIYINDNHKLLVLQYDITKANKRINSMNNYIKDLQNKTSYTKRVTENLKSQVYKTKIFSANIIFNEFYTTLKNFNQVNISLQHIKEVHDTFKEKQNFLNKIWDLAQVKESEIDNGLIKLNQYKNRGDEAIAKFELLKSAGEIVPLNYKEFKKIQDQINAILNNSEEIMNMFGNILSVLNYMDDLQPKLLNISKSILDNQDIMERTLHIFDDLDKQQSENTLKLNEYQKQLQNSTDELNHLKESQNTYEDILKQMKEYLIVLNFVPTTHNQLNKIEKEIKAMEETIIKIDYLNRLLAQKDHLRQQVNNVKAIIESLPDDDSTLCEAAQTEPKLNLN